MLLRSSDSVHQFLEYGLNFATCKHNYVFSSFIYLRLSIWFTSSKSPLKIIKFTEYTLNV